MNKKALDALSEIKKGKVHKFYILAGENNVYLKNNILDELKKLLVDERTEAFDFITCYGKNLSSNEVSHFLNSPPFGRAKLVIVKDGEQVKKQEIKKIFSLNIPEFSTLVILFNSDIKANPVEKDSVFVNSYSITKATLRGWIKKKAKEYDKKISDDAVSELAFRLDNDLFVIASEIKKLALYVGENKEITKKDVVDVVEFMPEIGIFNLTDTIVSGKKSEALRMLKNFLDLQNSTPEQILFLLMRTFMQMALIKELSLKGVKKSEIASKGGIHPPFLVGKLLPIVQRMKYSEILQKYHELNKMEVQSKKGEIDLPLLLNLFIEKS
jgi:DNA polymerase-3 subunit delta